MFCIYLLLLGFVNSSFATKDIFEKGKILDEHTLVTNSNVFPYVAAILKKSVYISAGALIDEKWVLTAADALFLMSESLRTLRVRLGSINNKKGGLLIPVMYYEIHPYFDDSKPEFDVALIRLSQPVRLTPSLYPIRLQKRPKEVTTTHFIVTAWQTPSPYQTELSNNLESMEVIKRRRILSISHLHPTDPEVCEDLLNKLEIRNQQHIMCLDSKADSNFCERDPGAPVVFNGVLWGIESSWRPEECDIASAPTVLTLVSAANVSSWIHSTVHGHRWARRELVKVYDYGERPRRT